MLSFPGKAEGVNIEGTISAVENGAPEEPIEKDVMADDDDDEDLDLFGDMTEEEKAAAEEKKKQIEAKKAKSKANALKAKSMIIIDVKPWDDTTGTPTDHFLFSRFLIQTWPSWRRKYVQSRRMDCSGDNVSRTCHINRLEWCHCTAKLVPVGFGIKKLQITAVIEDAKIESFDAIIEDDLVKDGDSENIQSVDVVAFNKI